MTNTMNPSTPTDDVPRKAPSPAYVPRTLEHDGTPDEGVVHLCSGIRILKCDFTQVTLKRIRFTDELRCMRINDQDWGPGGDEVSANDDQWTETGRSWPVCYVVGSPITLSVKVELGPSKARAAVCKLTGKGTFSVEGGKSYELMFESVEQSVGPGEQVFEVRAQANGQPQSIQELGVFRGTIDWELGPPGGQTVKASASSKHELFVIFGRPRWFDAEFARGAFAAPLHPNDYDAGITTKRMRAAINRVRKATGDGTAKPLFHVLDWFMGHFPSASLQAAGDALFLRGHPDYVPRPDRPNFVDGIWPLDDDIRASECQAMCRYTVAMLRTVGYKGDYKVVFAHMDPQQVVREPSDDDRILANPPPPVSAMGEYHHPTHPNWWLIHLPENDPAIGRVGPQSPLLCRTLEDKDPKTSLTLVSPNKFAGCIRAKDGGAVRYYGGGWSSPLHVGTAREAVETFHWLVWAEKVNEIPDYERVRIMGAVRHITA